MQAKREGHAEWADPNGVALGLSGAVSEGDAAVEVRGLAARRGMAARAGLSEAHGITWPRK